jgi:hypothetical protein
VCGALLKHALQLGSSAHLLPGIVEQLPIYHCRVLLLLLLLVCLLLPLLAS